MARLAAVPGSQAADDRGSHLGSHQSSQRGQVTLRLAGTPPLAVLPKGHAALQTLQEACRLLEELRRERDRLDERLTAARRLDPVKSVTGQTALERACAEMEELIRTMDEHLSQTAEQLLAGHGS